MLGCQWTALSLSLTNEASLSATNIITPLAPQCWNKPRAYVKVDISIFFQDKHDCQMNKGKVECSMRRKSHEVPARVCSSSSCSSSLSLATASSSSARFAVPSASDTRFRSSSSSSSRFYEWGEEWPAYGGEAFEHTEGKGSLANIMWTE